MPSRRDGRIEPGQPLRSAISASAWNRAQDAADLVLGQRPSVTAEGPVSIQAPFSRIKLRWTAQNPDRVLKPWSFDAMNGNVVNYPSEAGDFWDGVPLLNVANSAFNRYDRRGIVVPLEPIKSGSIGWATVSGVVWMRIDVKDAYNTHAMPFVPHHTSDGTLVQNPYTDDNAGEWRIQTFPFAGYKVVWANAGAMTDNVWALIDLSSYWAQPLVLGLVVDRDFGDSGSLVRLVPCPKPDTEFTADTFDYYVAAKNAISQGVFENGTFVWMLNPYSLHRYANYHVVPPWEIVAVEHEPWSVNAQGVPTNSGRANQTVMLPKP